MIIERQIYVLFNKTKTWLKYKHIKNKNNSFFFLNLYEKNVQKRIFQLNYEYGFDAFTMLKCLLYKIFDMWT